MRRIGFCGFGKPFKNRFLVRKPKPPPQKKNGQKRKKKMLIFLLKNKRNRKIFIKNDRIASWKREKKKNSEFQQTKHFKQTLREQKVKKQKQKQKNLPLQTRTLRKRLIRNQRNRRVQNAMLWTTV